MRFRWHGTLFRLHPLTVIMAVMACFFGLSDELLITVIALCAHEFAHLLAARGLNITITAIDILPFGGSAHMQNPYALNRLRLAAVAFAGPFGNLALATVSAALGWAEWIKMTHAAMSVQSNLILMLFNLLPALPLDGGRILFALFSRPLGEIKALAIGIWLGRILALTITACAITAYFHTGRLNITMLLAALIMFSSGKGEWAAQKEARTSVLWDAYHKNPSPHRLTLVAACEDCSLLELARTLRIGEDRMFAVFSKDQSFRFASQAEILGLLTATDGGINPDISVKDALSAAVPPRKQ